MIKNKFLQVRLSSDEEDYLEKLSEKTCLSKSSLVRLLILGYMPKEKPPQEFFEAIKEMYVIGNNLNQLVSKAHSLGFIDIPKLNKLIDNHNRLITELENKYVNSERSDDV